MLAKLKFSSFRSLFVLMETGNTFNTMHRTMLRKPKALLIKPSILEYTELVGINIQTKKSTAKQIARATYIFCLLFIYKFQFYILRKNIKLYFYKVRI